MPRNLLDSISLENAQQELLQALVEAILTVGPRPKDQKKFTVHESQVGTYVSHPGLPGGEMCVYLGNVQALKNAGLLDMPIPGHYNFDVTPRGCQYYGELKQRKVAPLQAIEDTVRTYLERSRFQQMYPQAYEQWSRAGTLLWGPDPQQELTTIGHLCREAMQAFVTALVSQHGPSDVDTDQQKTVARLQAVLRHNASRLGKTEEPFLEALISYWGTVSDLVQRQVHGLTKEGEPLAWEDGRRVVFQTAIVMFEIDTSLSRST